VPEAKTVAPAKTTERLKTVSPSAENAPTAAEQEQTAEPVGTRAPTEKAEPDRIAALWERSTASKENRPKRSVADLFDSPPDEQRTPRKPIRDTDELDIFSLYAPIRHSETDPWGGGVAIDDKPPPEPEPPVEVEAPTPEPEIEEPDPRTDIFAYVTAAREQQTGREEEEAEDEDDRPGDPWAPRRNRSPFD